MLPLLSRTVRPAGGWGTGFPTLPLTQVEVVAKVFAYPPRNFNDIAN
jgi:hypothetical protein